MLQGEAGCAREVIHQSTRSGDQDIDRTRPADTGTADASTPQWLKCK